MNREVVFSFVLVIGFHVGNCQLPTLGPLPTLGRIPTLGPIPTLAPVPTLAPLPTAGGLIGDFIKLFPTFGPLPTLPSLSLNAPCTGTTSLQIGSSRADGNCQSVGGVPDGQCALNLGVCCAKAPTCGATILLNNTYFANPDYPNATITSKICPITVTKLVGAIQVRIDFIDVKLAGPDEDGRCQTDSITIEGVNPGFAPPRLCGDLSGQHIYLPVDQTPLSSQITVRVGLSGKQNATWAIKVTQIDALQGAKAPTSCMQYHYGALQGNITNFNFDVETVSGLGNIGGLSYSICFRNEAGYCSVRFHPSNSNSNNSSRSKPDAPYYTSANQVGNRPGSFYGRYIQRQPQYGVPISSSD